MDQAAPQAATRETTLAEVAARWGDDYEIRPEDGGGYLAVRRDGTGGPLTAATPGALWDAITAGYAAWHGGER